MQLIEMGYFQAPGQIPILQPVIHKNVVTKHTELVKVHATGTVKKSGDSSAG